MFVYYINDNPFGLQFQHAADPSRYNKLLQRQAEGKKRLRMIGEISVPRDAFINVLKRSL